MLYRTENPHGGDVYTQEILLDFSANTNPLGTPQGVLDAITQALGDLFHYPDPYCRALVEAIAQYEAVEERLILCGNGAAELIYAYCEALRPKKIAELAPTFAEYSLAAEHFGAQVTRYFLRRENDFSLDAGFLEFLQRERPEVVFLCNPNNPTGRTVAPALMEEILRFCKKTGIRLFVDECFLELCEGGESLKSRLPDNPQLFLLKAFTKNYALAGLRLGYCLSSDGALLKKMSEAVQPWNVSLLAQAAGVAALREREFLQKSKALIHAERLWLKSELEALGFWVCPASANYLLFSAPEALREKLRAKKIAIRSCANYCGLGPGWYRSAVRLPEENRALIQAIKEVL